MEMNTLAFRGVVLRAVACTMTALMTFGSVSASTLTESEKHAKAAAVDAAKAIAAALGGRLISAAWYNGWAIGEDINAATWALKAGLAFSPLDADPNHTVAVSLTPPVFTALGDGDAADIFGVGSVDPSVTSALNNAMMHQMAVSAAYAGFQLADRRLIGALNANDLVSAQARYDQMLMFRDQAVSEIPGAQSALLNLSSVAGSNALNIVFTVPELTSIQSDLMANGRSGFGQGLLDDFAAYGFTNEQIDNEMIFLTLDGPYSGSDLFSTITDQLAVYDDSARWLGVILEDRASRIPAPSAILGLSLAAGVTVGHRRRR